MPSNIFSPITLASAVLSIAAFVLSLIVSIKIRALSLVILSRPATAITKTAPTLLYYFTSTAKSTENVDYKYTASSHDYIGMINVIGLCCVVMLLLSLLCLYLYQIYVARYNANRPFITVYLQLTTSTSQVYIPFLELRHAIQHYIFGC